MPKFKIYKNGDSEEHFVLEEETLEECQKKAKIECDKRGWKAAWSMMEMEVQAEQERLQKEGSINAMPDWANDLQHEFLRTLDRAGVGSIQSNIADAFIKYCEAEKHELKKSIEKYLVCGFKQGLGGPIHDDKNCRKCNLKKELKI